MKECTNEKQGKEHTIGRRQKSSFNKRDCKPKIGLVTSKQLKQAQVQTQTQNISVNNWHPSLCTHAVEGCQCRSYEMWQQWDVIDMEVQGDWFRRLQAMSSSEETDDQLTDRFLVQPALCICPLCCTIVPTFLAPFAEVQGYFVLHSLYSGGVSFSLSLQCPGCCS